MMSANNLVKDCIFYSLLLYINIVINILIMKHYEVAYYTKDWAHLTVTVDAKSSFDAKIVAQKTYDNIAQITEVREVLYKW